MLRLAPLVLLLVAAGPAVAADETLPLAAAANARVGRVEGTRAFIALSLDGRRLRAYVCDGTVKRKPTLSQWFKGRWDGRSALKLSAGGYELRIDRPRRPGGRVTGRLGTHAFSAMPASMPAGLFERGGGVRATWIALDERRIRGTMVPTRPRKCRPVLVSSAGGTQQWVTVCS